MGEAQAAPGDVAPGAAPFTISTDSRLPPEQLRALKLLCERRPGKRGDDIGIGADVFGPVREVQLSEDDQRVFDGQWVQATLASLELSTPEQATAAGYVQASGFDAGVGVHWIKWSLVGGPFDPATPSMLLFDGMPGRARELVGFSYWVGSDGSPNGFAGSNDRWHHHASLCFSKSGWLIDQSVSNGSECRDGFWLNGQDLWMLHAWVVPGLPNSWGRFAPTNPFLCPRPSITTPDLVSCSAR